MTAVSAILLKRSNDATRVGLSEDPLGNIAGHARGDEFRIEWVVELAGEHLFASGHAR